MALGGILAIHNRGERTLTRPQKKKQCQTGDIFEKSEGKGDRGKEAGGVGSKEKVRLF